MPVIGITGASGALGALVLDELLALGAPASSLVALVRDSGKVTDRAAAGITVRVADYDDPGAWPDALAGIDTLLLISAGDPGKRVSQHEAVIRGAKAAGVRRVVYTSLLRATTSPSVLAPDHRATEELLAASGLAVTLLRNGWYIENYTAQIDQYLGSGVIVHATGETVINAATRADYAAAAARVLLGEGHEGKTYELSGTGFTLGVLASTITKVTGKTVSERDVPVAELASVLENVAGMPAGVAAFVASLDGDIAQGALATSSTDLADLLGRPSTPLATAVRDAVHAAAARG
jgi:uncharacterized protein YbjT (DUF2867 family)